jgi:hypothetical protein
MSKKLSPGRIYKINGIIVRAKRQYDCNGCIFNNPFSCPRVDDSKDLNNKEPLSCIEDGIIFISP